MQHIFAMLKFRCRFVGRAISQLSRYQKKAALFLESLIEERKAWRGHEHALDKPVGTHSEMYMRPLV